MKSVSSEANAEGGIFVARCSTIPSISYRSPVFVVSKPIHKGSTHADSQQKAKGLKSHL